jgi:23S rRNA (pseudouridine1915-N3)-methyltransferase
MRLHFVWIGKTKDRQCSALTNEYLRRLAHFASCEISELKEAGEPGGERVIAVEGRKLLSAVERDDYVVLLDERGQQMSSAELAEFIRIREVSGTRRMAFIIGGFAGVSDAVREKAQKQLALSRLTFTHEMARVILTEQIYRAYSILAGLPYHKP